MVKTFIISKRPINLELHIDGKVEVKPLPDQVRSPETVELLAQTYQTFVDAYMWRFKNENLEELAIRYFKNKGFELKEKESSP